MAEALYRQAEMRSRPTMVLYGFKETDILLGYQMNTAVTFRKIFEVDDAAETRLPIIGNPISNEKTDSIGHRQCRSEQQ
jgi:hypothetical protein